jgi:nucleoside diphosphate kinase
MKVMKIEKLSKETDLAAFYASNKDKIIIENKLKKMREGVQLLVIMNQPAAKKRKIITASINPKLKN